MKNLKSYLLSDQSSASNPAGTADVEIRYPFTKPLVFAKVMEDPILCKELIQRIFSDRKVKEVIVREIVSVTTEATLIPGVHSKYIRLDVLFEDDESWYNIEMQVAPQEDLPHRGRYYSAVIDVTHLDSGQPYGDLHSSFVIFICRFDHFGLDEPLYTFERFDIKKQLPYGDGSYIIIINTACSEEKVLDSLRSLFRYINDAEIEENDWFIGRIHDKVKKMQSDEEVAYNMTLEEDYLREITKAERRGRAEGLAAGKAEGLAAATDRLNRLTSALIEAGRIEDLQKSAQNPDYQEQLLQEFGI